MEKLREKGDDPLKMFIKGVGMLVVGLSVAVLLYPLLHEGGHTLAALAVGAEVRDFRLFPLPSILCNAAGLDAGAMAMVGIGGMTLPLLLSLAVAPRSFWPWYVVTLLRGINILSLVIAAATTLSYLSGHLLPQEDITVVLDVCDAAPATLAVSPCLTALLAGRIAADEPIKRIEAYLEAGTQDRTKR
ncbi:MAG: hypothetical protein LUD80_01970 [Clostridiales bacterium]|nr:hypothetical protein [Clostridiales bacterium]